MRAGATVEIVPDPAALSGVVTSGLPEAEGGTRQAVVHLLMSAGPLTAAALADRLGLSTAGVRRHLDQLVEDGEVTSRPASSPRGRGRGRPARAYLLTDAGRARFPHAYDQVAIQALRFLRATAGPAAVTAFARDWAQAALAPARPALAAAADVAARSEVVTEALTDAGFAASLHQVGIGRQLCQHHCPVAHVAAEFPQFCEEEMHVLTAALGTYAQRIATIARGDSFCTTFIPRAVNTAGPELVGTSPSDEGPPAGTEPPETAPPEPPARRTEQKQMTAAFPVPPLATAPTTSALPTTESAPLGRTSS
nr:helix-turn-helix domain-containing protein [Nakamurella flavida]